MTDGARNTRLAALMAANGYFLIKLLDFLQATPPLVRAAVYSIGPILGLGGAYLALLLNPSDTWARNGELISVSVIAFNLRWFFIGIAFF